MNYPCDVQIYTDQLRSSGWEQLGPQTFCHYSGARIAKRGNLWIARTSDGSSVSGHSTLQGAALYIEGSDLSFWTFGRFGGRGMIAGFSMHFGMLDYQAGYTLFVVSIPSRDEFPEHLKGAFAKHFFEKATCAKCAAAVDNLYFLELPSVFDNRRSINLYTVCRCGYPVWRLEREGFYAATRSLETNDREWKRRASLAAAGGKHTGEELKRIAELQKGRCIYCNKLFTDKLRPSKDHILPVVYGGSDSAMNILMACRSCNSRRNDMPFRTYCKLLSPAQNKRILGHLLSRIISLNTASLSEKGFTDFEIALSIHDPRHWRYLDIQARSLVARSNAKRNKLLPKGVLAIMRKEIQAKNQALRKTREALKH